MHARNSRRSWALLLAAALCGCAADDAPAGQGDAGSIQAHSEAVFWNGATIYFLLTDRFTNGEPANDLALGRPPDGAVLRSFRGGDLQGVLQRLEEGYFDSLGVSALWLTPFVEQIRGSVDEGTGKTYGYHGYWARDWTRVEPALGTDADLKAVVNAAHARGIRVLMDAVINHTGPVTPLDPQWPDDWVRTGPRCLYQDYASTVDCTLVDNLPDIRTDSDREVELPAFLVEKWRDEGRLDVELQELDAYFDRTGHPRAPRYYLMKWLTDWVRELGIDGYRVDTAKHFEEDVSVELAREARQAFEDWKEAHPGQAIDDRPFYVMGEVYNYEITHGRDFDFGDRAVDFYAHGYDGLINFGFKRGARGSLDELYASYAATLRDGALLGRSVVNYVSSHDDGEPFDRERADPIDAGTRLLLAPGAAQVYYGDELARPLRVEGAEGDAHLRSFMNWEDRDGAAARVLEHWRRLGRFRRAHPAIGGGEHRRLQVEPYVFMRRLETASGVDRVVVALEQPPGEKTVPVGGVFPDGTELRDAYSGATGVVSGGAITLTTPATVVLLEEVATQP